MSLNDTIYALASARGIAGVAVIRVSGPSASEALRRLSGRAPVEIRKLSLRSIRHPTDGLLVDEGLVCRFDAPHSFTGEDVVEFHVHGGLAVVEQLLDALGQIGLRMAEPGEFTRRAFENGRMDLTQVEGLSDLILAQTEAQHRQAVAQLEGALKRKGEQWKESLTHVLALGEATIDFSDEELPPSMLEGVPETISEICDDIGQVLAGGRLGEQIRHGLLVAVLGPPNVGKSSLLNQFAARDVAIVSEEAGTTRDVIEVPLNIAGVPVTLCDAAGLREAEHSIEKEGVRRARLLGETADFRLWVNDATDDWDPGFREFFHELHQPDDVILINKTDLVGKSAQHGAGDQGLESYWVSAATGEGIEIFLEAFSKKLQGRYGIGEVPLVTRQRHRLHLENCLGHLRSGLRSFQAAERGDVSLFAEDIRLALRDLAALAGRVDVEDVLDVIFREFCIGK